MLYENVISIFPEEGHSVPFKEEQQRSERLSPQAGNHRAGNGSQICDLEGGEEDLSTAPRETAEGRERAQDRPWGCSQWARGRYWKEEREAPGDAGGPTGAEECACVTGDFDFVP